MTVEIVIHLNIGGAERRCISACGATAKFATTRPKQVNCPNCLVAMDRLIEIGLATTRTAATFEFSAPWDGKDLATVEVDKRAFPFAPAAPCNHTFVAAYEQLQDGVVFGAEISRSLVECSKCGIEAVERADGQWWYEEPNRHWVAYRALWAG